MSRRRRSPSRKSARCSTSSSASSSRAMPASISSTISPMFMKWPTVVLLAVGLTFIIGAGEIDLCFPAILGFSGFAFAVLFKEYQLGWIAVLAGLASGVLVGFINGVLVAKVGIPSFIATLGTQFF